MQIEYAIIGTGPSGTAAAAALIDAGFKPTFIDAGSLTQGEVLVAKNRSTQAQINTLGGTSNNPGQKAWFGSYDAYLQKFETKTHFEKELNVRPSNAIGGFSRVWGATFDYWPHDSRWPEEACIEEFDYKRISELLPLARVNFGPESNSNQDLPAATSSKKIYRRLSSQRQETRFQLTPAQLAIQTKGENSCVLCASCLEGCPQDAIWFSAVQVQMWLRAGKASLLTGLLVQAIQVEGGKNLIECVDENEMVTSLEAKNIYIAAGAIGTALLVLNSTKIQEVQIRDTSTIFTAGLSTHKQPQGESGQTLSQFWLKWGSEKKFAAQVYAPNKNNLQRLTLRFRFLKPFERALSALILRMHPIIIYLDETISPTIILRKSDSGIKVTSGSNAGYRSNRKWALGSLRRGLLFSGVFIPPVGSDFSAPGTGYHFGASFPMGTASDNLGRIEDWQNIHIVDSSVLPYLEVGSITPTVMANAHRIARLSVSK